MVREELIEEDIAESGGEDFDGEEEGRSAGDPAVAIEGQTAAWDDAVQMGVIE